MWCNFSGLGEAEILSKEQGDDMKKVEDILLLPPKSWRQKQPKKQKDQYNIAPQCLPYIFDCPRF